METAISTLKAATKFLSGENKDVCRLCCCIIENRIITLEDTVLLQRTFIEDTISFHEMFQELNVENEPLLPQNLCMNCSSLVINSFLFQRLCEYSNSQWDAALSFLENKVISTDHVKSEKQTMFMMLQDDDGAVFTTHKQVSDKKEALAKIKLFLKGRKKRHAKLMEHMQTAVCEECGETCKSKGHLMRHKCKVHFKSKHPCPHCNKSFFRSWQVEDHIERVHLPKKIKCKICEKMFSTQKLLKGHIKQHHEAVICKLCFIQVPSRAILRAHLDRHGVETCPHCNKTFNNKNTFRTHVKTCADKDNTPKFYCDICNKGYAAKSGLRTHMKVRHGFGKTHSCKWCGKKFEAVSSLKSHTVKHTRERNFHCEHCGNRFVTQAALVYHIRLHTGERPFPCDLCSESFLSASRRMEHKRRKHFEPSKECPICMSKFTTGHELKKHVARHYNPHSKLYMPQVDSNDPIQIRLIFDE